MRLLMNNRLFFIVFAWLLSSAALPASKTNLGDSGVLIELATDLHFTEAPNYTNTDVYSVGASALLWENVVLGASYHYWVADIQELQGQLGIQWGNPRVRYRVLGGMGYPISGKLVPDSKTLLLDSRFQVILKLNSTVSWIIESGYRWAKLNLDLSGPFLGTGIGIHF